MNKKPNKLNVIILKQYDLILSLIIAYLKKYPEQYNEYDFIEIPPVKYIDEICSLIDIDKYLEIKKYIEGFTDEASAICLAVALNDQYMLHSNIDKDYLSKLISYGTIEGFADELRKVATNINWDYFYNSHSNFYNYLISELTDFPSNMNLGDINEYYGLNDDYEFYYIPSILMNGGFGPSNNNKLYYAKGFIYNDETEQIEYDPEFICEALFHEYSHPFVNKIVDKYFDRFSNIDDIYKSSIENGLPKTYHNKKTLLYEYFVRSNAYTLTKKYYPNVEIEDWVIKLGFTYLPQLADFVYYHHSKYDNYEKFFVNELINYVNNDLFLNENTKSY